VPGGYTNREILLANARGFLLQKEGGAHTSLVYQLHGGGYVGVFSNLYNRNALRFSALYGDADVFSLDYRTAPENTYPSALEDAIDGYRWLLEQGYNPAQIIFCGESAGGGLAVALTLWLRDHEEALPSGLILSSPWTDLAAEGESYHTKIQEDAFFGSAKAEKAPKYPVPIVYAGKDADLYDPYLSPAYGTYSGFPPLLIQTGEAELLLSDSNTVVQKAKQAGVDVTYFTYPNMYHTFNIITPNMKESRLAWQRTEDWLRDRRREAEGI
jgi:acetyl esterase/lipase